jgi:transposase InsO family protein
MTEIRELYHNHAGTLGYRLISDVLERKGIYLSYPTTFKYMQEMGIKATLQKKKLKYVKGLIHKTFDNLLEQNFTTSAPNEVWCTDFTYLELTSGKRRYNCSIVDLYDRSVIASKNSKFIDAKLAVDTLKIAIENHKPSQKMILHSDYAEKNTIPKF